MSDIQTITSTKDFREVVREKIVSTFMSLIPEQELENLIKKEINDFFNSNEKMTFQIQSVYTGVQLSAMTGYGSTFRQLVWTELHRIVHPKIVEILRHPDNVVDETMQELMKSSDSRETQLNIFETLIMNMSRQMFSSILAEARNQTKNMVASAAQRTNDFALFNAVNKANEDPSVIENPVFRPE
jgi:hypothetical protein